jgi:tetratricopeptide (TPR) repeat protein
LYLKGRYLWNKRVPEEIRKAVDSFDLAIKQDPDFALAYVGLADCYVIMADWGSLSSKEAVPKAKSLLATALRIDEKLAEAHASLAVLLEEAWEWSAAEAEYKHAIALNPNYATAHLWYSNMLDTTGRIEESLREITIALDLDPVSTMVNTNLGRILQRAGRLEEAMEQYRKTLALEPDFVPAHMRLGEAYVTLSKFDEGIAEFRRAEELAEFTWPKCFIAYTLALAGSHEQAKQLLAELEDPLKGPRAPPAFIAAVHFALGDQERAYLIMKKCVEEHSYGTTVVLAFPFFCKMQVESRFKELWEMVVQGTRIDTDVASG